MAITKPPRRNLPPAAEAWGRYVDQVQRQAQVDIDALRRDLTSGLRSVSSSMNRIANQQSTLESQQSTLAAQQQQLSNQLSTINTLVDSQVSVSGDTITNNGFTMSNNSWTSLGVISLSAPSWATRAVVSVTGVLGLVANQEYAVPEARAGISGSASQAFELPPGTGANAIPFMGTVSFTRVVTGVGSSVTGTLQVRVNSASQWHTGSANRRSQLSVTAIFTR